MREKINRVTIFDVDNEGFKVIGVPSKQIQVLFFSKNLNRKSYFKKNRVHFPFFFPISESDGRNNTLDTLPEGKLAEGGMQYKRVYSDWKPTIEKTDVVGAMEAIAGKFQ